MSREIMTLAGPPADFRIPYGDGEFHFADLRLPPAPGPHPVIIVIHGGFWRAAFNLEPTSHMAAALALRGAATWNIEYRRIGHTGGGYPGTLDDVAQAALHLRSIAGRFSLDLHRVVAIGHSAGGQLALRLDAIPLSGIVPLGGVADLRLAWERKLSNTVVADFLGGSPAEFPARYRDASPIERLPRRVPVRLVHGEQDDVVPIAIAESYERAARAAGDDCRLLRFESDHFDIIDPRSAVWPRVCDTILDLAGLR